MNKIICENCKKEFTTDGLIGTHNRNHCPFCLYSKHVDLKESGDRKCECGGLMEPIALTFKKEGTDKYGKEKQGEIMVIQKCQKCGDISINRIAGDDNPDRILEIFSKSKNLDQKTKTLLKNNNIIILEEKDEAETRKQLFGVNC